MKAILINKFGASDVLQLTDFPNPMATDDQVLIQVVAAGLNPVDTKIRSGNHISCASLTLPAVLGKDMSGRIVYIGKNVNGFQIGDAVFGCINNAYAEYVAASPTLIVPKPSQVSFDAAAAVSLAGMTAYQAIHNHLQVSTGQHVLIQSAAGGVGHLALQFAKLQGARVTGTASGKNNAFLKALGIDQSIDYQRENFEDIAKDVDAVMDTMGGEILYRSIALVKPGGRVVCLPSSTKDDPKAIALAKEKGVELIWFMMQPQKEELQIIATLMEKGRLKVEVQEAFAMEQIAQAHDRIEKQGVRGKLVLQISERI